MAYILPDDIIRIILAASERAILVICPLRVMNICINTLNNNKHVVSFSSMNGKRVKFVLTDGSIEQRRGSFGTLIIFAGQCPRDNAFWRSYVTPLILKKNTRVVNLDRDGASP